MQIITGGIDIYGLSIPLKDTYRILKDLLSVELGVQIIEFIFAPVVPRNPRQQIADHSPTTIPPRSDIDCWPVW
jgi:hypothetical protein